jgi:hypothetical protein
MTGRIVRAALAAALALTVVVGPAAAAKPESSGPACADIKVQGTYVDSTVDPTLPISPVVKVVITTAAPSCTRLYYSAYVQYGSNSYGAGAYGNGTNRIELTLYLLGSQNEPWVYLFAMSSSASRRLDIAPNVGTLPIALNDTSQPRPAAD